MFRALYFKVFSAILALFLGPINSFLNIADAEYDTILWLSRTLTPASSDADDIDHDGLINLLEDYFQTDKNDADSDGDGLNDYYEALVLGTDPLKADTDGNGIKDGDEDFDKDGVSNLDEMLLNGNPFIVDTDGDGLEDGVEKLLGTSLDVVDSDYDGLSDAIEMHLGSNPLKSDSDGDFIRDNADQYSLNLHTAGVNKDSRAALTVNATVLGSRVESFTVSKINSKDVFFSENIPGFLCSAYKISVDGTFNGAQLTYNLTDTSRFGSANFKPAVYQYNEANQAFDKCITTIDNNHRITAQINKLGTYILLNETEFEQAFSSAFAALNAVSVDSDGDGLTDAQENSLLLGNGIVLKTNPHKKDTDGDGLSDSAEVKAVKNSNGKVIYFRLLSDPTLVDSDRDGFTDDKDISPIVPDAFQDFTTYKKYAYDDVNTMTVFVDVPFPTSRDVIDFTNLEEYDVGHTFVGMHKVNEEHYYSGFYPEDYGPYHSVVRARVIGYVKTDAGYYRSDYDSISELLPYKEPHVESEHEWEIAKVYVVDEGAMDKLKNYSTTYTHRYDMVLDNCATFAIGAFKECANIDLPIYEKAWTISFLNEYLNTIGGFVGKLFQSETAKITVSEGMKAIIQDMYRGYCPADAGEDLRQTYPDNHVECVPYTLKDGTQVNAVIEITPSNNIVSNGLLLYN